MMNQVLKLKLNDKYTFHAHTSGQVYYWMIEPRNIQYHGSMSLLLSVMESLVNAHDVEILNGTPAFTNRVESLILKKEDGDK